MVTLLEECITFDNIIVEPCILILTRMGAQGQLKFNTSTVF